jgi:hypothetical protein
VIFISIIISLFNLKNETLKQSSNQNNVRMEFLEIIQKRRGKEQIPRNLSLKANLTQSLIDNLNPLVKGARMKK